MLWRNACWQTGIKESGTPQAKYHTPDHRWHATVHMLAGTTHLLYINIYIQDECLKLRSLKSREVKLFLNFPRDSFMYLAIEIIYRKKRGNKLIIFSYVIWSMTLVEASRVCLNLTEFWYFPHQFSSPSWKIFPLGNKVALSRMRRAKPLWPDSDGHTQHSSHCSWPGSNIKSWTSRDCAHNTTSHCCFHAAHSQCFCFSECLSESVGRYGTTSKPAHWCR